MFGFVSNSRQCFLLFHTRIFFSFHIYFWVFSAAVVLVFFVCWTPFHAQRLMFVIVTLQGSWTTTNGFAHHVLFLASGEFNIWFDNKLFLSVKSSPIIGFG
jgi:hypothetical protein